MPLTLYTASTEDVLQYLENDPFLYVILPVLSRADLISFALVCRRFRDVRQVYAKLERYPPCAFTTLAYCFDIKPAEGPLVSRITEHGIIMMQKEDVGFELVIHAKSPRTISAENTHIFELVQRGFIVPVYWHKRTQKIHAEQLTYEVHWPTVIKFMGTAEPIEGAEAAMYRITMNQVRMLIMSFLHLTSPVYAHLSSDIIADAYIPLRSTHHFPFNRIARHPSMGIHPHVAAFVTEPEAPFKDLPETVVLYDYQRSSIGRLRALESRIFRGLHVGTVEQSITFTVGPQCMHLDTITCTPGLGAAPNTHPMDLFSRGLFIADGTGLGKTTEALMLALAWGPLVKPPPLVDVHVLPTVLVQTPTLISPLILAVPIERLTLFYTRASVVYIKKELLADPKGWLARAREMFPSAKIVILSTRAEYVTTTYMDIACADLVLVTSNLLNGALMSGLDAAAYNTGAGGLHPANLAPTYMQGLKSNDTHVHLGLFVWQRFFVDEAHELINRVSPTENTTFLCTFTAAHVRYYMSATPWDSIKATITATHVDRIFGEFLGLYVTPPDPIMSINMLRQETRMLLAGTYAPLRLKSASPPSILSWTRVAVPSANAASNLFYSLRYGLLGHAISMACMRSLVSRNTDSTVIREVSLARAHTSTVKVPVHHLFFVLDDQERKLGIFTGLHKYVCHTKDVRYIILKHNPIRVDTRKLNAIASPREAVTNMGDTAKKLVAMKLNNTHSARDWNPVTKKGNYWSVNEDARNMDTFIANVFGSLPTDTRHGPFPLFAARYVSDLLDQTRENRVVMATKHRILIHALQSEFKERGIMVSVLGSSNLATASKNLGLFDANVRVIILHAVSAAAGLNLQTASHLILLDDPTTINAAETAQLVGRLQRINQKLTDVHVVHLVPESSEPHSRPPVKRKLEFIDLVDIAAYESEPSSFDELLDIEDVVPQPKRARYE